MSSLASAGSPGTDDAPERVAGEEAAGPGHRARLRQSPEVVRRALIPAAVDGQLRLAVVADLERQLGCVGRLAERQLARARTREVVQLRALDVRDPPRGGAVERDHEPPLATADARARDISSGGSPEMVWSTNAPAPSWAPTNTSARQRSESLSQSSTSGGGLEPREALEHLGHLLGEARIGRHAPVLAPPVEPAAGQQTHGLVQLLVERELEDDLRVPGVVREQPDRAPLRLRLVRIDSDTNLRD